MADLEQVTYKPSPRTNQQGILPSAIKTDLISYFNSKTKMLEFKDTQGDVFFTIDPNTGAIISSGLTTTDNINAQTINSAGSITGGSVLSKGNVKALGNVYAAGEIFIASGGSNGGGSGSFFTSTTSFVYINASRFTINPDNYLGLKFYLNAVYRAGAFGDPARTFYMSLFDVLTGNEITNAAIYGSTTSSNDIFASLPTVTGVVDFRGNLLSGARDYVLGIKSSIGGNFVDLYAASLIISKT